MYAVSECSVSRGIYVTYHASNVIQVLVVVIGKDHVVSGSCSTFDSLMTDKEEVALSLVQRDAIADHAPRKGIAMIEEHVLIRLALLWILEQSGMVAFDSANEHDLRLG